MVPFPGEEENHNSPTPAVALPRLSGSSKKSSLLWCQAGASALPVVSAESLRRATVAIVVLLVSVESLVLVGGQKGASVSLRRRRGRRGIEVPLGRWCVVLTVQVKIRGAELRDRVRIMGLLLGEHAFHRVFQKINERYRPAKPFAPMEAGLAP